MKAYDRIPLAFSDPRTGLPPGRLPPSWADGRHAPPPGLSCACCGCERFVAGPAGGWCCAICHPPARR